MTLTDRDRRALKLGAVTVVTIAVYFLIVEPLAGRYDAMVREHNRLAANLRHGVLESRKLTARRQQVNAWEEKAGPLIVDRTYGEQITAVGSRIVTAAGESQVQLQGTTPGPATPWVDSPVAAAAALPAGESRFEQATIQIDAQAGWEDAFKFIAALYRIEGVLSVEQLELSSDPKQGGKLKMRLAISVLAKWPAEGKRS